MLVANVPGAAAAVVPRAGCQSGDKPDTALQGQVPLADRVMGRAAEGYFCNLRVAGTHEGRVFSALDAYKHCLYAPDQTWTGAGTQTAHTGLGAASGIGVRVLDMSDPEHPKQTATLDSPMALAPDESLTVNDKRGLLVMGSTFDSQIDVYDLTSDCAHPKLVGTFDMAPASGHAGWFSPDGNTFWLTNIFGVCVSCGPANRQSDASVFPIDLTDPAKPKLMGEWIEPGGSGHNGWVSDDGTTSYACQTGGSVETNRVVVYKTPPQGASKVSGDKSLITSFPLDGATCQDTKAVSYRGRPFLIANSEYTVGRTLQKGPNDCEKTKANPTSFGTPQVFDISDVTKPRLASALMLEVDDPANCNATANDGVDPTGGNAIPGETYDTHFCRPDRLHDPTILACARFLSGLEVYDIRDPYNPKEIAYFRPGALGQSAVMHPEWEATPTTVDMVASPPVVVASRGEISFGSYFSGVRVVRFPKSVYPFPESLTCSNDYYFNQYNPGFCPAAKPSPRVCVSRRSVRVTIRGLRSRRVRSVTVSVDGRRRQVRRGNARSVMLSFKGRKGGLVKVRVVARLATGSRVVDRRSYNLCVRKRA